MFQPILPQAGLTGWVLLNRTLETQTNAFNASPEIIRDTDYFEANIAEVSSPEELVSDRRMLRVALGAFGLEDDINNRYLIQKVLEGGTEEPDSLANLLADERYKQMSEAFGFGSSSLLPETQSQGFGGEITALFRARSFEVAVGQQDETLRLSMNAERELQTLAQESASDDTRWYQILGTPPLRAVFETAFGLPTSFGQLDIERQLEVFKESAKDRLGVTSIDDFGDEQVREDLIQTYLLRDQLKAASSQSSQAIALSLLQGG